MMDRRLVQYENYTYEYSSDGLRRDGGLLWALVSARLVDELTSKPPMTDIQVKSTRQGVYPRITQNGLVGVIGHPERLFTVPDLQNDSLDLSVVFSAKGYVPLNYSVPIGPIIGFPDIITNTDLPVRLGEIALHRNPTTIRGRIVSRDNNSFQPVAGAEVSISSIFRTIPPPKISNPTADPYHPVSLMHPLYAARPVVTTAINKVSLVQTINPEKMVVEFGNQGTQKIKLSNTVGLEKDDFLHIESDIVNGDPTKQEVIQIESITRFGKETSPAWVNLVFPLSQAHRINTKVTKVVPQTVSSANQLGVDAIQGDQCLLMDSVNGLVNGDWVEISDSTDSLPKEFHMINRFKVTTDPEGYYVLPPLSRVAQINLHAELNSLSNDVKGFIPDYDRIENVVDIVISEPES